MPRPLLRAIQIVAMFAILFVIAFLTRIPAMRLHFAFALHAVLAAPFYACCVTSFRKLAGVTWPVCVAGVLIACVLGTMSPVMAIGNGLPAIITLAIAILSRARSPKSGNGAASQSQTESASKQDADALVFGTTWGALAYPCTILGGFAFGNYAVYSGNPVVDVMLFVLACALAYAGALLADVVVRTRGAA